jgi:hypothetical protein
MNGGYWVNPGPRSIGRCGRQQSIATDTQSMSEIVDPLDLRHRSLRPDRPRGSRLGHTDERIVTGGQRHQPSQLHQA